MLPWETQRARLKPQAGRGARAQRRLHTPPRPTLRPFAASREQVETAPGYSRCHYLPAPQTLGLPRTFQLCQRRAHGVNEGGDSSTFPSKPRSRGGVGGPAARSPTEGPGPAHREGDVPDAAHRIAVVSRVDSPGEDLMQMHLRIPGGPSSGPEEGEPRAPPQPLPVRPRDSAPRSPVA